MVVPVSKIPDFTLYIREIAEGFSFDIRMFGHAGDGNIHVYACKKAPVKTSCPSRKKQNVSCTPSTPKRPNWAARFPENTGLVSANGLTFAENLGPLPIALMQGHQAGL